MSSAQIATPSRISDQFPNFGACTTLARRHSRETMQKRFSLCMLRTPRSKVRWSLT
jgi:hypothetical protein